MLVTVYIGEYIYPMGAMRPSQGQPKEDGNGNGLELKISRGYPWIDNVSQAS